MEPHNIEIEGNFHFSADVDPPLLETPPVTIDEGLLDLNSYTVNGSTQISGTIKPNKCFLVNPRSTRFYEPTAPILSAYT